MIKHHAERQLTKKYNPDYSYLDEYEDAGFSFKEITSGKTIRHGQDYDSGYTKYLHLITSRSVSRSEMSDALHVYNRGCSCSYDCCGHYFGGAVELRPESRTRNGKARRWRVAVSYSPNY